MLTTAFLSIFPTTSSYPVSTAEEAESLPAKTTTTRGSERRPEPPASEDRLEHLRGRSVADVLHAAADAPSDNSLRDIIILRSKTNVSLDPPEATEEPAVAVRSARMDPDTKTADRRTSAMKQRLLVEQAALIEKLEREVRSLRASTHAILRDSRDESQSVEAEPEAEEQENTDTRSKSDTIDNQSKSDTIDNHSKSDAIDSTAEATADKHTETPKVTNKKTLAGTTFSHLRSSSATPTFPLPVARNQRPVVSHRSIVAKASRRNLSTLKNSVGGWNFEVGSVAKNASAAH